MRYVSTTPGKTPGPLRKLVALVTTVAMFGLVLMFSAVLLALIALVGMIAWGYLWWKSRELRKRMRDVRSQAMGREQRAGDDGVFEGEVIRVVDSRNGR